MQFFKTINHMLLCISSPPFSLTLTDNHVATEDTLSHLHQNQHELLGVMFEQPTSAFKPSATDITASTNWRPDELNWTKGCAI